MNGLDIERRSPDGQHVIRLEYDGEIRFGPPYFRLHVNGRLAPSRTFGDVALWSSDSQRVAVQEWLTRRENEGPKTRLVVLDVRLQLETDVVMVDGGFVEATNLDGDVIASTGTFFGTGRVLHFRHELPAMAMWRQTLLVPAR